MIDSHYLEHSPGTVDRVTFVNHVGFLGGGTQSPGILREKKNECWADNHLCPVLLFLADGCT